MSNLEPCSAQDRLLPALVKQHARSIPGPTKVCPTEIYPWTAHVIYCISEHMPLGNESQHMVPADVARQCVWHGACLVNRDVVVVVSEGRLNLNADFLKAQQLVADHNTHYQIPVRGSSTE